MNLKRKNGDKDIKYLVNDSKLNLKILSNKNIILIGERHGFKGDENLVRRLIQSWKPDYVLVEGLGDLKLMTREVKEKQSKIDKKSFYYQDFTKHWIDISLESDVPFIGMEYTRWDRDKINIRDLTYKESFAIREAHFLKIIRKYAKYGKVLAITGDTHLRSIATEALGPISPLYSTYIGDKSAAIIRSAEGEIE